MTQILHVVVVGFHHKKGCQVEFAHPPLTGSGDGGLPEQWSQLPSLAMPDGSHNSENDTVYFTLPSVEHPSEVVFGISCYRQIPSEELIEKTDEVSRNTVQKSVCVLARIPLYGVLKAKLQLITQAYFNERDFSKVEVLSQMHTNLCEMFDDDLVDGHAASMDIPVRDFFLRFRHRAVLLFKLLLLEKRVLFFITPAQLLGDTMLSLVSLFPRLLEEGLRYSCQAGIQEEELPAPVNEEKEETSDGSDDVEIPPASDPLLGDPFNKLDSYGFPLSIFTKGNIFEPYLSVSFLDVIKKSRSCVVGATNALFAMKKDNFDAVVTIDESGSGVIEVVNLDMKRSLVLTSADLRFGDYILKNIETNNDSSVFEGGDEWIRLQMRNYLLSLIASARSQLSTAVADFGTAFVSEWLGTNNYLVLVARQHEDLSSVPPGHAFAGQLGLHDVLLRVEHNVTASENARKALTALSTTGKNIGETGLKVKQSLTSWLKGGSEGPEEGERGGWLRSSGSGANLEERVEDAVEEQKSSGGGDGGGQEGIGAKVKLFASWFKREPQASSTSKNGNSRAGTEIAEECPPDSSS